MVTCGSSAWSTRTARTPRRYCGTTAPQWEVIPGPDGFVNNPLGHSMAFGPDGMLWVNTSHPEDDDSRAGGLARFDGTRVDHVHRS